MKKKKCKSGFVAVISVLGVLVFILFILLGILAWNSFRKLGKLDGIGATSEMHTNSRKLEDGNLHAFDTNMTYVVGGYEFTVPAQCDMFYNDTVGTVVYMDDVFQMKTEVVDTSYEEVMQQKETLTQASVDAGGTIIQDIQEMELDGRKYAYYRVSLSDEVCLVVYTQAPDADKRIAAQIAVKNESASDKELLQVFSAIAGSACKTEKPDSDYDDVMEQISEKARRESYGMLKEESTMEFHGMELTHKVPNGFYMDSSYEDTEYMIERYRTAEPWVDATCYLYDSESFDGAYDYIAASKYLEDSQIETMDIEGTTIYYVVEKYKNEDSKVQSIYAGCDLGDNQFYVVKAYVSDEEIDLQMDTIQDFLVLH